MRSQTTYQKDKESLSQGLAAALRAHSSTVEFMMGRVSGKEVMANGLKEFSTKETLCESPKNPK